MPEVINAATVADGVEQVLAGVNAAYQNMNLRFPLEVWLHNMQERHGEYYAGEVDPSGEPWQPLAPFTVRKKGHDTILVETGRMKASLESDTEDSIRQATSSRLLHSATFGTRHEHAMTHQLGDESRRIPQRMHVGMTEHDVDRLVEDIADEIVGQLRRGG